MDFCNDSSLASASESSSDGRSIPESAEAALVRRLRAGEPGAFEEMVRVHGEHLLAVARAYLRQEADAEDAVQEALLRAFSCFHQFKEESRLSTWLHRIVVNAALMSRRSRSRKREVFLEHDEVLGVVALRGSADGDDPAEHAMRTGTADAWRVAEHIRALPECHQSVIELRLIQHRSTTDAARELDITPAALKTKLHRAKAGLHRVISQDGRLAHRRTSLN